MAIKTLLLQSKLRAANARRAALQTREAELRESLESAEEISPDLEAAVDELNASLEEVDATIAQLQEDIAAAEAAAAAALQTPPPEGEPAPGAASARNNRGGTPIMPIETSFRSRSGLFRSRDTRAAFYAREDIKGFLARFRALAANTRDISGADLTIPTVALEMLRDNLNQYSKLIKHCTVKPLKGKARQAVAGDIPEAVWLEATAALNELVYKITQIELDAYKVGGFIPVANSYLEDSDVNLGEEIMWALGQAIGLGLDKALVYGTGSKMPVGFVTRLAASEQPAWWGTNQGTFTDLHSSNVLTLNIDSNVGAAFFAPLTVALGKAKPNFASGGPVWICNRKTHIALLSKCAAFDSGAMLKAGMDGTMPIIGGAIEELEFMDDNTIAGGYLSLEIVAEREGAAIESNAGGIFFLGDITVFRGMARYDAKPAKGEGFVLLRWDNNAPTTQKSFAADYANTDLNTLLVASVAGTATGDTLVTVSGVVSGSNVLKYIAGGQQTQVAKGQIPSAKWTTFTSASDITVATGKTITVVELDSEGRTISVGNVIATAKA